MPFQIIRNDITKVKADMVLFDYGLDPLSKETK